MAKQQDEHAGSGLDKPDPKSILEKLGDTVKSVLPKASASAPSTARPAGASTVPTPPTDSDSK